MRLPRALRTTSFRLVLLYALLFAASVAVLGAFVYWTAQSVFEQQIAARIRAESTALQAEFRSGGLDRIVELVRERLRERVGLSYLVVAPNGERLAGDLPLSFHRIGWINIDVGENAVGEMESDAGRVRVLNVRLGDGARLAVGDDLGQIEEVGEAMLRAFGSAAGIVLILGMAGGLALSIGFLKRVDSITRTAEAIIAGDLTERIPTRGTSDDFDRLAVTLNRMLDRNLDLMESLRQVSNDIAHDLRTPLARLRQRLESMRDHPSWSTNRDGEIDTAIVETDTILETFGALLRIAQIEAGTRRAGFREVDLSAIFETVIDAFAPAAEDAGKTFVAHVASGISVRGDRELLTQMLANLIDNAIRHTPDGAQIEVSLTRTQEGRATGMIADTGPGVPEEERERIFRRFYRLERSRSTTGSGLGLSLVAAVAALHEINIEVQDNRPGLRVVLTFQTSGQLSLDELEGNPSDSAPPALGRSLRQARTKESRT